MTIEQFLKEKRETINYTLAGENLSNRIKEKSTLELEKLLGILENENKYGEISDNTWSALEQLSGFLPCDITCDYSMDWGEIEKASGGDYEYGDFRTDCHRLNRYALDWLGEIIETEIKERN